MNDEEELYEWLNKHPARHAYEYGMLETYIFLFDCTGCPSKKLKRGYKNGLHLVKQVVDGYKDISELKK